MWTFLAVSLSHNDEGCAYSNELISFCLMKLLAKKTQAEVVGGESPLSNNQRVEGGQVAAHQRALLAANELENSCFNGTAGPKIILILS